VSKLDPRFLVNRSDTNGVLLPAISATPEKPLVPLACLAEHLVDFDRSAVGASRILSPPLFFHELDGG
jgi:hypothetical protein